MRLIKKICLYGLCAMGMVSTSHAIFFLWNLAFYPLHKITEAKDISNHSDTCLWFGYLTMGLERDGIGPPPAPWVSYDHWELFRQKGAHVAWPEGEPWWYFPSADGYSVIRGKYIFWNAGMETWAAKLDEPICVIPPKGVLIFESILTLGVLLLGRSFLNRLRRSNHATSRGN